TAHARALPPAASISAADVKIVPGNLGCGSVVLAAMTMLAPSRAARRPMALPMPRLAPVMKIVLPFRSSICFFLEISKQSQSHLRCRRTFCVQPAKKSKVAMPSRIRLDSDFKNLMKSSRSLHKQDLALFIEIRLFPPHPQPSPSGRGRHVFRLWDTRRRCGLAENWKTILPLPLGEGWGEGKGSGRRSMDRKFQISLASLLPIQ